MTAKFQRVIALAALAFAAATVLACGGGGSAREQTAPRRNAQPPAVCRALRAAVTGAVKSREATELSGLVVSRTQPGVLWAHNDSGDRPRVFALRRDGTMLADLAVPGARAIDWEDIALRGSDLYIGDIGDNDRQRRSIDVYRVVEPRVPATVATATATATATRLRLRYVDAPHNAETLLVDPRSGDLAVVTKELDGRSGVYVATAASPAVATTLRLAARLTLGAGGLATGGDVSADGSVIAIRTYDSLFAWRRQRGMTLAAALRASPCTSPTSLGAEGHSEALALTGDGRAFFTVPEGSRPSIRRYAPAPR